MLDSRVECGHCGYDIASLVAANAAVRCPECGAAVEAVRPLLPWPSKWRVLWDLMRVQAAAVGVVAVLTAFVTLTRILRGQSQIDMGCTLATIFVAAVVVAGSLIVFWPLTHAGTITQRHASGERFWRVYGALLLIGWSLGAVLAVLGAVMVMYAVVPPLRSLI